jgi:hypothetical protein
MRSMVVAVASLLVLAGCAGKPDDNAASASAAAADQAAGVLPEGQSAVMPGPHGPVLHVGKDQYPLYPPP